MLARPFRLKNWATIMMLCRTVLADRPLFFNFTTKSFLNLIEVPADKGTDRHKLVNLLVFLVPIKNANFAGAEFGTLDALRLQCLRRRLPGW
jgi:hypothetical protein